MRRLTSLLILALTTSFSTAALANNSGYAALGYAFSKVEPKNSRKGANVDALQFGFGGWFNHQQTFGAEGRIALGINDGKFTDQSGNRPKTEISRYYGGYFRAQFPNTLPVRPYGLLGVTRVETKIKPVNGNNSSRDYNDVSLGFGVDLDLAPNIFVFAEYLRVSDRSSKQVSNFTIGMGGRF